jgi:hypothetical protein
MKRYDRKPAPEPAAEPEPVVEFSVRLTNGHFESVLRVPLSETEEKKKEAVDKWLRMIQMGIEFGVTEMSADLGMGKDKA